MIRHVIFDLDGVLWNSKEIHLEALNDALKELAPGFVISYEENHGPLSELPSRKKLLALNSRGLDPALNDSIIELKQQKTLHRMIDDKTNTKRLQVLFKFLKQKGIRISVVTNAHRETAYRFLIIHGLSTMVETILGNEDVVNNKPSPDGYLKAMREGESTGEETLIFEDTSHGLKAACGAGAYVVYVDKPTRINRKFVGQAIKDSEEGRLKIAVPQVYDLKVVMPMAGEGSRFRNAGYDVPKPFIEVDGKHMYETVLDSMGIQSERILLARRWGDARYDLTKKPLRQTKVIEVALLTEGAACTVLLSRKEMTPEKSLIIVNSDNIVRFDYPRMMREVKRRKADGAIVVFTDTDPKWSFAKIGPDGYVTEVAEKNPISDQATAGVYFWTKSTDFAWYADRMIMQNKRVRNEFYVCPVYNEAVADGKKIIAYQAEAFHSVGTPEDLGEYLMFRRGS
jgi:HAD superfamily hydrolase (TIGR01509 family)